jgi:hypothetical protein
VVLRNVGHVVKTNSCNILLSKFVISTEQFGDVVGADSVL